MIVNQNNNLNSFNLPYFNNNMNNNLEHQYFFNNINNNKNSFISLILLTIQFHKIGILLVD